MKRMKNREVMLQIRKMKIISLYCSHEMNYNKKKKNENCKRKKKFERVAVNITATTQFLSQGHQTLLGISNVCSL